MAVVFIGGGVAALQEAGVIDATAVRFVSLPLLGIHPTAEGLGLQALALVLIAGGLWANRRKAARTPGWRSCPLCGANRGGAGICMGPAHAASLDARRPSSWSWHPPGP